MGLFQLKSATLSDKDCYVSQIYHPHTHFSRVWIVLIKGMPENECHKLVHQHRVSFLITLVSFALTESHCAAVLLLFSYIYILLMGPLQAVTVIIFVHSQNHNYAAILLFHYLYSFCLVSLQAVVCLFSQCGWHD